MKAARIVVLGVALAAGGIAAFLASGHREPEPAAPPPPAPTLETVEILVAKSNLDRGQVIGENDIGWQLWPKAAANPSFISKTDRPNAIHDFVGAVARESVASGEPVREPAVVFTKGSGFLAAILPHGMRAVSTDISAESAAGGFILPDDHVDVMLTRRDRTAEKLTGVEKFVGEAILRNVRVLAIDQQVEEKNGQKVVVGRTATLELTPSQIETLAVAHQQGTISLALRSIVDSRSSTPEGGDEGTGEGNIINTVRYGVSTLSTSR